MRERRGAIRSIRPAGSRARLLEVEAIDPPAVGWRAGQFVSVRVDAAGERRSFSIVSPPGRGSRFELLVGAGRPGATRRWVDGLEPGAAIDYFGPMGYFTPPADHRGELICGATGIGISAVLPILAERGAGQLLWSVRRRAEAALLERVEALPGIELSLHVTGEGDRRLTEPLVRAVSRAADPVVVLCGNPAMIRDVIARLAGLGVDTDTRVITEMFYPPAAPLQM